MSQENKKQDLNGNSQTEQQRERKTTLIQQEIQPPQKQQEVLSPKKGSSDNKLFDILKAHSKSIKDGKFIYDNILNFAFIQKFFGENLEDENMAIQLCRQMGFQEFQMGDPIMKQGDESDDKLYIIAEGRVGIVIAKDTNIFKKEERNKNVQNTRLSQADPKAKLLSQITPKSSFLQPQQDQSKKGIIADPLFYLNTIIATYGTKVNELSKGDGFGEKALLLSPSEAKRNASIIALVNTFCITVLRKDFVRIQDNFNKENQLREQLLTQQMPFLKTITSSSTKEALILYFKNQSASRGKYLTQEGKVGDQVFILQSGKVTIERKYLNTQNIYYQDYQTVKISEISEPTFIGEEILFIDSEMQEQLKLEQKQNKNNNQNQSMTENGQEKQIETLTTENDELIQETYKYTVRVDSLICKFFVISKAFFISKFPKEILYDIKKKYLKKENARQIGFERNKINLEVLSNNRKGHVESTFQMMNEITNKEIFQQMKPQMIENQNKILLRKQEQAVYLNHVHGCEKYEEELSLDFRKEVEKKYEEIEKKKVLLKQRFNIISKQRAKEMHHPTKEQHDDPLKISYNSLLESKTPQHSPIRPQVVSKNEKRHSIYSQDLSNSNMNTPKAITSIHHEESMKHTQNLSPLQKLKLHKNIDGSLDAVELMTKVKYKKIQIEDISITDIMGEGFDVFDNQEANRLLTIKSTISKEKEDMIEIMKDEQQRKMVAFIKQKSQKGEVSNLDLGYLSQFQKIQHFKLVHLGKIKMDSPSHHKPDIESSTTSNLQIKDKILAMKYKDQQQQAENSQIITGISYLTPSSQRCATYNSHLYPEAKDLPKLDQFSDYFSTFHRMTTSASTTKPKDAQSTPSIRRNLNLNLNNNINNNNNLQIISILQTKKQSVVVSEDMQTNPQITKEENPSQLSSTVERQQNILSYNKRSSLFSRGYKSKSTTGLTTNRFMMNPNSSNNNKNNNNEQQSHRTIQRDINNSTEKCGMMVNSFNNQTKEMPRRIKTSYYSNFSLQLLNNPYKLSSNSQTAEEILSLTNSPLLTVGNSVGSPFLINLNTIPQTKVTPLSEKSTPSDSISNLKQKNKTDSMQNLSLQSSHIVSSRQFMFNQFLADKNKQRKQLCFSRDSKFRQQSLQVGSQYTTCKYPNTPNFVLNSFLK